MNDRNVLIIGDGPAGLSAGLFLSKMGIGVDVFGVDQTPMHKAMLYNYLGIDEMTGSDFQEIAREQVENFGGDIHETRIASIRGAFEEFRAESESGDVYEGDYVLVAASDRSLLDDLGVEMEEGVAVVDRNGRTGVEGVYAAGWATRKQKIQAVISAGDGAAAALDIASREAGEPVHDFDVVE